MHGTMILSMRISARLFIRILTCNPSHAFAYFPLHPSPRSPYLYPILHVHPDLQSSSQFPQSSLTIPSWNNQALNPSPQLKPSPFTSRCHSTSVHLCTPSLTRHTYIHIHIHTHDLLLLPPLLLPSRARKKQESASCTSTISKKVEFKNQSRFISSTSPYGYMYMYMYMHRFR